jgi:hypothetical protein
MQSQFHEDDLVTYEYIDANPTGRACVTGRVIQGGRTDPAGSLVFIVTRGTDRWHAGEVVHIHPSFVRKLHHRVS